MTTQLLIYERAVPVSSERHKNWSVKAGTDYSFAAGVNAVPLLAAEFLAAAGEYPVVFTAGTDACLPTVILGGRQNENLYVDDDGTWKASYIPAFVRRYPFVFSSQPDSESFMLCIDEEFDGCNTEGRGERLFDANGERTQYLQNVLRFLQAFQDQHQRTRAFCARLKELDLLEPMQARFQVRGGQSISLGGFSAVSRDKLKALGDDALGPMVRSDELELIYAHLHSLRHLRDLGKRMGARAEGAAARAPTAADADETAPQA